MDLDRELQRRLVKLAEREPSPLGAIERQRILAHVRDAEADAQASPWRVGALGGLLALVACAASIFALYPAGEGGARQASASGAEKALVEAAAPPDLTSERAEELPARQPARCASLPVPSARERAGRRGAIVDLGERARFVLSRGARGEIVRAEPCSTIFALSSGSVAVHAKDLADGELIVRTATGDVVVHGTIFSVALGGHLAAPGGPVLEVRVAEGEVGVVARAAAPSGDDVELARLHPGDGTRVEPLRGADGGRSLRASSVSVDVDALTALVSEVPRPRERAVEPEDPVASTRRGEVLEGAVEIRSGHPLLRTPAMRPLRLEAPIESPLDDLP